MNNENPSFIMSLEAALESVTMAVSSGDSALELDEVSACSDLISDTCKDLFNAVNERGYVNNTYFFQHFSDVGKEEKSSRAGVSKPLKKVKTSLTKDPRNIRQKGVFSDLQEALESYRFLIKENNLRVFGEWKETLELGAKLSPETQELAKAMPTNIPLLLEYHEKEIRFKDIQWPLSPAKIKQAEDLSTEMKALVSRIDSDLPSFATEFLNSIEISGFPLEKMTPQLEIWLKEKGLYSRLMVSFR